jgi:hypothetical protein
MQIGTPLTRLMLESLSPEAAKLARGSAIDLAVAVVIPGESIAYEVHGDAEFPLLSVGKVPIMFALMQRAISEKRPLSSYEQTQLSKMIRESDNNAANALWSRAGGRAGLQLLFDSVALKNVEVPQAGWGDTSVSPLDMATLLGMVVQGLVLDGPMRQRALELLGAVSPWQDWGALAGAVGDRTGIKNGWYPERRGWLLNSLAYVQPADTPAYVLAVFTDGALLFNDGVAEIERLSVAIHAAMQQRLP